MLLSELFESSFIKIGLECEDKEEAFEELADAFCQASHLNIREEILEAVRIREHKMSTGIKKGIAVPHARISSIDRIYGILGISRKGIDYDALDKEPVYLIFMVLVPKTDTESHLGILKMLSEMLQDPQFFTDLTAQNDSVAVNGIIKKYESIIAALN